MGSDITSCGFSGGSDGKESAVNVEDPGLMPGEGNGNPLQYFCLENSVNRGAWRATVHEVAKRKTKLREHVHTSH